jgi:regulatory protein YycI of two-component signal transduction system YycFG
VDWSKAKTILIIAFLLLNIFMLAMIVLASSNEPFTDDYIKYSKEFLTSKNIEVKAAVPRISRYTGKVLYSSKKYDINALCRLVFGKEIPLSENESIINIDVEEESIVLSDDELYIKDKVPEGELWFADIKSFEDRLVKYLKNIGFNESDLLPAISSETEQLKEIIFNIKYKYFRVYDQQIIARLDDKGTLTISAPNKVIKKENGKGEVISVYQVLVMGGLPSNTVVEHIDIGYRRINEGDLYGVPVWRIELDDGTILFYNGFTGEKLD